MNEKLKNYRKSNGLSKKKMAKELGISIDEYKQIENTGDIDDKLKKEIYKLLKSESAKGTEITVPKYMTDITKSIERITSVTKSPMHNVIEQFNYPTKGISLTDITSAYKQPELTIDYLKDINKVPPIGWSGLDTISSFYSPIKEATDKQLRAYQGIQTIFNTQPESLKSAISIQESLLANITKPIDAIKNISDSTVYQSLAETISKNRTAYIDYVDFSSKLAKTLSNSAITNSIYSNWITPDSFLGTNKSPSALDVLSGSSFTLYENTDTFKEEQEIIEQIDSNPKLKEQADNFFNELNKIINDDTGEEIDQSKILSLYEKFVSWISETFQKKESDAKRIAKKIFKAVPYIALILTLSFGYFNSEAHKKTHKELESIKSILLEHDAKTEREKNELIDINREILNVLNSGYSQNMIAIKDVNLRTRRSSKSKILGVVSASQEVIVLDKKLKWMEIIYVDANDNTPKTGWVWKEYFGPQVNNVMN